MGRKPKYGQAVTHTSSGRKGIVTGIVGHIIQVTFKDGTGSAPAGSFHKTGGGICGVIIGCAVLIPAMAWIAAQYLT